MLVSACGGSGSTSTPTKTATIPSGKLGRGVVLYSSVSAGFNHTCAVKVHGHVVCWGDNYNRQSNPPNPGHLEANPGQPGGKFSSVSSGREHTCGVQTSDDQVVCWGYNRYGKASPPG